MVNQMSSKPESQCYILGADHRYTRTRISLVNVRNRYKSQIFLKKCTILECICLSVLGHFYFHSQNVTLCLKNKDLNYMS